jgi:50S ribosomal protein L16 3-hydroxylase
MLYLPPGVPHNGVAEDACLTFSVGMRAPSAAELIGDYLDTLVADADEGIRYQDGDLTVPADPFEIDAAAMGRVVEALNALRMNDPDRLGEWFGRFITTYRSAGTAAVPEQAPDRAEVEAALAQGAVLQRHPMTRMAWRRARKGAVLFASGQALPMPLREARLLAAAEVLDQAAYQTLGEAGRAATAVLVSSGHYVLPGNDEDDHDFDTD